MRSVILQSDTIRVKTQHCPINKCPDEIFLMVFEEVAQIDEDNRFKEATTLSHVCKRWRVLALRTSSLWIQIDISMYMEYDNYIKGLQEFMDRTRLRIGSAPAVITMKDIRKHGKLWNSLLNSLNLDQFPHIAKLAVWLEHGSFRQLLNDSFRYSNGPLDSLLIAGEPEMGRIQVANKPDCACIFRNFPTAGRVRFQGLITVAIGGEDLFPYVFELSFDDVEVDILPQLYRFPNLTVFSLTYISRRESWTTKEILLPTLVEMEIVGVDEFPWDQIRTPRLRRLTFGDALTDVVPFLRQHASLKHIDCRRWLRYPEIRTLSDTVRDVEKFGLYGDFESLFSLKDPPFPFPNVIHWKLYFLHPFRLPLQVFENLVQSRCLRGDEQHEHFGGKRIEILEFEGPVEDLDEQPWRKSSLLTHFDKSFARVHNSGTDGTILLKLKPCNSN